MSKASTDAEPIKAVTADVSAMRVARVYADALYGAAEQRGQAKDVLEELDALINQVLPSDPKLEFNLRAGGVSRGRRDEILRKSFDGRTSETFFNFLLVLSHHDRLGLLRAIRQAYRELYEQRTGQMAVEVRSA